MHALTDTKTRAHAPSRAQVKLFEVPAVVIITRYLWDRWGYKVYTIQLILCVAVTLCFSVKARRSARAPAWLRACVRACSLALRWSVCSCHSVVDSFVRSES